MTRIHGRRFRRGIVGHMRGKTWVSFGAFFAEVVDGRSPYVASYEVLKRRTFIRVVRLPHHRLLLVGWLPL
jgi:hypothetical protein